MRCSLISIQIKPIHFINITIVSVHFKGFKLAERYLHGFFLLLSSTLPHSLSFSFSLCIFLSRQSSWNERDRKKHSNAFDVQFIRWPSLHLFISPEHNTHITHLRYEASNHLHILDKILCWLAISITATHARSLVKAFQAVPLMFQPLLSI